jgi:protein-disulfide isomerase
MLTRRAFTVLLSSTALAALAGFSPLRLVTDAMAQAAPEASKPDAAKPDTTKPDAATPDAAAKPDDAKPEDLKTEVAKPVSLPDMVLGSADAPITIVEYAAVTCPHCARVSQQVFPKVKSQYIDTGKVRYVFREYPLNKIDIAGFMLARRIANGDSNKYFAIIDIEFKQQAALYEKTTETLHRIGKQAGMSPKQINDTLADQAMMDKIEADEKYASDTLKVEGTPTFFINGEKVVGELSFDEMDAKIKPLLKS